MTDLKTWFEGIQFDEILQWLMFAAAALLAISVHESSHALSACWLGDDTAKRMHRISLNPFRHLDLVGFLMMVIAHFGWAKPVPVNMNRFKNPKVGMALTAAAGPISNVLLALLTGIGYWTVRSLSFQQMVSAASGGVNALYYLSQFLYVCYVLNAGLAVFNLIPISPLDGSKILAIVLPEDTYRQLMRYERYGFLVLIGLLYAGVLDGMLIGMRELLMDGVDAVAIPLATWIAG